MNNTDCETLEIVDTLSCPMLQIVGEYRSSKYMQSNGNDLRIDADKMEKHARRMGNNVDKRVTPS